MERIDSFSQAYSQAPWRKQLAFLGLFLLIVVFIALIAGLYLSVTARASATGREIQSMQTDLLVVEQSNADLITRLGQLNSAQEMETRARTLGFKPLDTEATMFLVVPGYVERQPAKLAPAYQPALPSASVLPAEYTESLIVWLQRQFNLKIFPLFRINP